MGRSSFAWVALGIGIGGVAFAGCVGDSVLPSAHDVGSDASTEDDSGVGTPDSGGNPGGDDAGSDAAVTCGPGEERCGDRCVDLTSASTDCGRCGHDCGGGACTASVCQAAMLVPDLEDNASFDADEEGFAYGSGYSVYVCPEAGCTASSQPIAKFTQYKVSSGVALAGGRVIFLASPDNPNSETYALYNCSKLGCADPKDALESGKFVALGALKVGGSKADRVFYGISDNSAIRFGVATCNATECTRTRPVTTIPSPKPTPDIVAGDDANLYFTGPGGTNNTLLYVCANAGCENPGVVASLSMSTGGYEVQAMGIAGGRLIVATNSGAAARIQSCTLSANGSCAQLPGALPSFTTFDVDGEGFVFTSEGERSIEFCPLTGCGAASTTVRKAPAGSTFAYKGIQLTSKYVYWLEDNAATRSLWRIARP